MTSKTQTKAATTTATNIDREALFLEITERHFFLDTLETRNSDSLDFHDVAVWAIRSALEAAFEPGLKADTNSV